MKLSKTAWLILGIGIFVIALGGLLMVYSQQRGEQVQIEDSLAAAHAALPAVISEQSHRETQLIQLESRLAQAELLLYEAEARFPQLVEDIEYGEILFNYADDWNLEITSLIRSEPRDKAVGGVTFSVTSFDIDLVGRVIDIRRFTGTIAASEYLATAAVERVSMTIPAPATGEEVRSSANIELVIYGVAGGQ
ncbi:MAG: hypothetical protein AAGB97_09020 [Dehalococcoidia bacterium]